MAFEVIRGNLTPELGVFGVILGQNLKVFKLDQTIYKNEAFGPMINIKWFTRSSEVILPQIRGLRGHLRSKFKDFQTLTPSFGVKIKKKRSGPQIASSEARGYQDKTDQPIASSEARG